MQTYDNASHDKILTIEMEAAIAYNKKALILNEKYNCDYEINIFK